MLSFDTHPRMKEGFPALVDNSETQTKTPAHSVRWVMQPMSSRH